MHVNVNAQENALDFLESLEAMCDVLTTFSDSDLFSDVCLTSEWSHIRILTEHNMAFVAIVQKSTGDLLWQLNCRQIVYAIETNRCAWPEPLAGTLFVCCSMHHA